MNRRRFFAAEVIQSSAMDCGPASLKSLLEGFGIPVSYGRLREACQTDVDGTSIDTLEDVANLLGLTASQTMLPIDHLFLSTIVTPSLIVVRLPGGMTHFVVLWRRHGRFVQVMDPAIGRRWVTVEQLLRDVYVHEQRVDVSAWREWAVSEPALALTRARLGAIGLRDTDARALIDTATAEAGWRGLATLDAAVRMTTTLVHAGAVERGAIALAFVRGLTIDRSSIPAHAWTVKAGEPGEDGEAVLVRGAVFIHVAGTNEAPAKSEALSPELAAALSEPPRRPARVLLGLLAEDGVLTPCALVSALLLAAAGTVAEAIVFRTLIDLARELQLTGQRIAAYVAIVALASALLFVELPIAALVLRVGRRLESHLRLRFLEKIPRLGDRYLQSRPKSDMAERSHVLHRIRHLPAMAAELVRATFELTFTTAGLIWLDPACAPLALGALAAGIVLPLAVQPALTEQDMRLRTHTGALSRFYLDALLGAVAIRTHGADGAMRGAHRHLLREWARAGLRLQRTVTRIEGLQLGLGFIFTASLIFGHVARVGDSGGTLLFVFWALAMPSIAQDLAVAAWQYPASRNIALRLFEPLGALDEESSPSRTDAGLEHHGRTRYRSGVAVELEDVSVVSAGHSILESVSTSIPPGAHVAIVGPSGAGKSSLVGLLLGWHRPASGTIRVDDEALTGATVSKLRALTAWVDPDVQLWNRSLLDNLTYGAGPHAAAAIAAVVDLTDLRAVLERLPDGLQTTVGEGGTRLSAGEGQRVRAARAMVKRDARLVILDEPFRGLEHDERQALLVRAREIWKNATLLCVTHDIGNTLSFDRAIVVEKGRIVEEGPPRQLARLASRYREMLETEAALSNTLNRGEMWRRLRLEAGEIVESPRAPVTV